MTAPTRTHKLTTPGDLHTIAVGQIRLTAQLTVDGGVTITCWQGPSRHDAVTYEYADKVLGRRVYAAIHQMAATGLTAREIADRMNSNRNHALGQVRQILEDAEGEASGRDRIRLADAITAEIQALKTDAEKAADEELVEDMRRHLGLGDCAADDEDEDPDDTPTGVPTTSAPSPTNTLATSVDKRRNLLDAYGVDKTRANRPRLAAGTNQALRPRMVDMLAEMAARPDGTIRLDTRDAQNRAYNIAKRGDYLELVYATPGVPASLAAARITPLGRRTATAAQEATR